MSDPYFKRISHKRLGSFKAKVKKNKRGGGLPLTNIFKDENDEEWCDQVVDALHVAASGMPDGPDKQDPFKNLKTYKHTQRQSTNAMKREEKDSIQHSNNNIVVEIFNTMIDNISDIKLVGIRDLNH